MNFYEKMRLVCLAIPEGTVATYGQIAMLRGKHGNSRQVGCASGRDCHLLVNKCLQAADKEKTAREKGRITKNYGIILLTFFGKCV